MHAAHARERRLGTHPGQTVLLQEERGKKLGEAKA